MKKRPSKTLTFFLSFCPGVGHLYLGAMTRGLQFLLLFFGTIALIDFFQFVMFWFWIPVIWFYGLFDALQLADKETIEDKPLVEWQLIKGRWVGYILIAMGLLLLVDNALPSLWNAFFSHIFIMGWFSFRTFLIALVLIIAGIFVLRGSKVKQNG